MNFIYYFTNFIEFEQIKINVHCCILFKLEMTNQTMNKNIIEEDTSCVDE